MATWGSEGRVGQQSYTYHLCNMFVEFCYCAHLRVRVKLGSGLTPDLSHTQPEDVLVLNWERLKHAAFDITVTSPLIPSILTAAELRSCSRGG